MQSQRLVTTSTSGHALPQLLLVLAPDSYSEGLYLSYASFPTPNMVAQFLYNLKQVRKLVAASLSPLSEPSGRQGELMH